MCTLEKRGTVYLLTLTGPSSEHRLNPTLLNSILSALSSIRADHAGSSKPSMSAALVTSAEGKFFSNGFDLDWARSSPDHGPLLVDLHRRIVAELISLPMPTVAAVTGHAAAAGLVLALAHDYVVMRSDRGFLYMSETDVGLQIPEYFVTVARSKVRRGLRDVVLASRKVKAEEAIEMGMVDRAVVGAEETAAAAVELGEELVGRGWDGDVYAYNRMAMMPEVCRMVGFGASKL